MVADSNDEEDAGPWKQLDDVKERGNHRWLGQYLTRGEHMSLVWTLIHLRTQFGVRRC